MAIVPTLGRRNQHGWPRRVCDESIMSSETRKKAWRSSVSHPRVAAEWNWVEESGVERSMEAVSRTEIPRLHFPPRVLCFTDYLAIWYQLDDVRQCRRYSHSGTIQGPGVVIHIVEHAP